LHNHNAQPATLQIFIGPINTATRPLARAARALLLVVLLLLLVGCVSLPAPTGPAASEQPQPTATLPAIPAGCDLAPVAQPTMPAEIPGYAQEDPATGLHMTGRPQLIDLATYRLQVTGLVDHPLSLAYDELRCMPKVVQKCVLVCPGFFQDEATWGGVPLSYVLDRAGVQPEAKVVLLVSADGYWTSLPLGDARDAENFLAYEQTGKPLPVLHGFPVRVILPAQPGGKWVKWLTEIRVLEAEPRLGPEGPLMQPTATN
jgi:DMSO/TMAO reductase YedYZ molybdopterin-dependent catalytic subunit